MLGSQSADFLKKVAFWSIKSSGLVTWYHVTGAALRMGWLRFFVPGAVLWTQCRQLCTQISIMQERFTKLFRRWRCPVNGGNVAELLRFCPAVGSKSEDTRKNLWTCMPVGNPFGRRDWCNKLHFLNNFLARENAQKSSVNCCQRSVSPGVICQLPGWR